MGHAHDSTDAATLVAYLATVPDPRSRRGRRYEWSYLLTVIAAAMMSGESTLVGIGQWLGAHEPELVRHLQPRAGRVPSLATVRRVLSQVSAAALEHAVGAYLQRLQGEMGESGQLVTQTGARLQGQAVDGKTIRCASAHGPTTHLVAVVRHADGLVLRQASAAAKLDECAVAQTLLGTLPLADTVTTFDALHTSHKQAQQIRRQGGHYLFVVKRNRCTLYQDIADAFGVLPPQGSCEAEFWQYDQCTLQSRGHGRSVQYVLESTPALNHYLAFPDVAQVVRRTRIARHHHTQQVTTTTEYLITSLSCSQVSLAQVGHLRRYHWTIENVTHYPRDVSFGEDRCQVHTGSAPQALAALRNAVVGTLKAEGWPYLPNGFRYCRTHLQTALQWLGIYAT